MRVGVPLRRWPVRRRPCGCSAPNCSRREVYIEAALYTVGKQNTEALSKKGWLHAAYEGEGNSNGPGPLLAAAAGDTEERRLGATSLVTPPCRRERPDASSPCCASGRKSLSERRGWA